MKILNVAIGLALLGAFSAGTVWAQGLQQPQSVKAAAFEDNDYVYFAAEDEAGASESPSDALIEDDASEGGSGYYYHYDEGPWRLPQPYVFERLGIVTGGWLQAGITVNGEDPGDRFNGPVLTNDRHGDLQMNELWLYFHRPVDTGGYGTDVGGRLDLLYGTDWRVAYFHGLGMEDKLNGSNQLYGFSIPQFYAEVAVNDLSVKLGRMTGILGYEIVPPMGNFFYSHSYALCYGEPILITGAMANYKLSDRWTFLAGFHQGIHRFEDNNDELNFQGGAMWNSSDGRVSLAYALDMGRNDFFANLREEYIHSFVLKYQLTERFLYVLQNDAGFVNGVAGTADAEWYGINQYFLYTIDDNWSAGLRVEWFRDDDGTRVLGLGNLDAQGWGGAPGFAGNFTELSVGVNWKPSANLTLRPEVRWDWYDGPGNGVDPLPFDAGNSRTQCTFGADLIVTF